MQEPIDYKVANGIATITLNRPHRLNALNAELLDELIDRLRSLDERADVVVLRGAGRAFSSGHDLKDAGQVSEEPYGREEARQEAERMQAVTRGLRDCPVPVIALVHGYAIGGGSEIAFSCDMILASSDTIFQFTETAVGLSITNGSSYTLAATLGPFVAKELVILGERFSAAEAQRYGLVNRVAEPEELEDALDGMLATVLARAPLAVRAAKRLINHGSEQALESALRMEVDEAIEVEMTEDAQEATRAFIEHRDPAFVGR